MAKISFELSPEEAKAFLQNLASTAERLAGKASGKTGKARDDDDDMEDVNESARTEAEGYDTEDADGDDADEFDGDDGDDGDKPTQADVQVALRDFANAVGSKSEAIALMKKHGGTEKLSKLDSSKYKAVIEAAKAATKAAKKKK